MSVATQLRSGCRVQGGEADAGGGLAALFEAHRAELARFMRARCGDFGDGEDLLHELWLKVGSLSAGPIANGRAYLFRMANNLVLDTRRARMRAMARDRQWTDADGEADLAIEERADRSEPADERIAREQEAALLRRAIETLPPGARRALHLHRFEGLPQSEVAEAMGISRSGVEKHLAVAMKHLRRSLADCGYAASAASASRGQIRGGTPRSEEQS